MLSLSTEYYQILLSQGICASVGASTIFCEFYVTTFGLRLLTINIYLHHPAPRDKILTSFEIQQ